MNDYNNYLCIKVKKDYYYQTIRRAVITLSNFIDKNQGKNHSEVEKLIEILIISINDDK
jgi:hypothetical protein